MEDEKVQEGKFKKKKDKAFFFGFESLFRDDSVTMQKGTLNDFKMMKMMLHAMTTISQHHLTPMECFGATY